MFKEWMNSRGYTYRELAPLMGIDASSLCRKANGLTSWSPRDLVFLHHKFGLSADFVLGLEEGVNEKPLQLV